MIRIGQNEASGVIDSLLGAKVKIGSVTMQNSHLGEEQPTEVYTIEEIGFRISLDGKCYAIVSLKEIEDKTYKLSDLIYVSGS